LSGVREVVYVACPLHVYGTPRYDRKLAVVRVHWPNATILEPKHLFSSNADWLAKWPAILDSLTTLVYFTDARGRYGDGVARELTDVRGRGLPIFYLHGDGRFYPDAEVSHGPGYAGNRSQSWRVRLQCPASEPEVLPPVDRLGRDQSLIVASFVAADGQRSAGVRFRQGNVAILRAYQVAVHAALAGDDAALVVFRMLAGHPDVVVTDTRARQCRPLTDGEALRRLAGEVYLRHVRVALRRKGG
jgi:hypothetical protein